MRSVPVGGGTAALLDHSTRGRSGRGAAARRPPPPQRCTEPPARGSSAATTARGTRDQQARRRASREPLAGIVTTDVGIRPLGYVTSMVVRRPVADPRPGDQRGPARTRARARVRVTDLALFVRRRAPRSRAPARLAGRRSRLPGSRGSRAPWPAGTRGPRPASLARRCRPRSACGRSCCSGN